MVYLYAYLFAFILILLALVRIGQCIRAENKMEFDEWERD
jgi:hypothetical protein